MLPRRFGAKVLEVVQLGFQGHPGTALRAVTGRLHRDSRSFGLRRDLSIPLRPPVARIEIEVRPLQPHDNLSFLDQQTAKADEYFTLMGQRSLLQSALETCYVAAIPDGKVAYMQWLIPASQDDLLNREFGDLFPPLAPDEALLEGAFTVPAYRGMGIMAAAMAQIAEQATAFGAKQAITFVDEHNGASLKGCEKAGFFPYVVRRETWRLMQRQIEFLPLPGEKPSSSAA